MIKDRVFRYGTTSMFGSPERLRFASWKLRQRQKERAMVDSKEKEEHSMVKNKHKILNGKEKKSVHGGPSIPASEVTCRTPNGVEKQVDYVLISRKFVSCSTDAEANDMIHMGSDHRSVVARFVIKAPRKEDSQKTHIERKKESIKIQHDGRRDIDEANMIDERYHELERKVKQKAEAAVAALKPSEDGTAEEIQVKGSAEACSNSRCGSVRRSSTKSGQGRKCSYCK